MRTCMREKIYVCGKYIRVHLYPVRRVARGIRGKRNKTSSEIQMKLNEKNSHHRLSDLAHTNFTEHDLSVMFSYRDDNMPDTIDEAMRNMQNFIRRVKNRYKKYGLPAPKYIYVTEMSGTGRIHHHIIISGGVDRDELEKIWQNGHCNSRRLQFDENGIQDLAVYIIKEPAKKQNSKIVRKWNSSKNLDKPKIKQNDYRVSRKTAKYIETHPDDKKFIESMYPEYYLAHCDPTPANEITASPFITLYLYSKDAELYIDKKYKNKKKIASDNFDRFDL